MIKQIFFIGVVIINAGLLDPTALGDVADAGGKVSLFEKEIDVSSMQAILKSAITAEKDSIVFYLGMKEAVAEMRRILDLT